MSNFIPASDLLKNVMQTTDEHPMDEPRNPPSSEGLGPAEVVLFEKAKDVLRHIYDPEIPVDIYQLGLIYDLAVNHLGEVYVRMTLTNPRCPVIEILPVEIETKIAAIPGVTNCDVEITWDPKYEPSMMSEVARQELNMIW